MTLEKNLIIAGVPALKIRDILKQYNKYCHKMTKFWFEELANAYGVKSSKIITALLKEGLIEKASKTKKDNEVFYSLTQLGSQFALAKAIKRKDRKAAEKILTDFLERVYFVNTANTIFLREVTSVVLFGSYLDASKETLGDLDLVVITREKDIDIETIEEKYRKKHRIWDFLHWRFQEENKALRFLKARNPFISLQVEGDLAIPDLKVKEIYNIDDTKIIFSFDDLLPRESIIKSLVTL